MKRCPNCNSRKWKNIGQGNWQCFNCGNTWKDPSYHTTTFSKDYHPGGDEYITIPMVDFHNTSFKFKILGSNGTPWETQKKIRGWTQEWHYADDWKALKTTKNVIIYINKRIKGKATSIDDIDKEMLDLALKAGKVIQDTYDMVIDLNHPQPLQKEIKLLDSFKSPIQMTTDKVKVVYPDGSIEFISIDAVNDLKKWFNNMALTDKIPELQNNIAQMASNFKLHQAVLVEIADTQKQQTEVLGLMKNKLNKPSILQRFLQFLKVIK